MSDRSRSSSRLIRDGWGGVQIPDLAFWRQEAVLVPSRFRRLYLGVELCVLYLGLPLLLYTQRHALDGWVMPLLMGLAAGCTLLLWYDGSFNRKQLWNREAFRAHVRRTLCWFVPGALLVGTTFALLRPDLLWMLPQTQTGVWLIIMFTYPVFSVYPQEIVFRTFFFHRYHPLFQSLPAKIVASGVAFGLAHIVFANWTAPLMTTVMGVLFALTYARTGSTLQASLEHGIWGWFAFTVGLGWYVFSGAIG
jgi:membrane protease YdiL (CAAX protease family)